MKLFRNLFQKHVNSTHFPVHFCVKTWMFSHQLSQSFLWPPEPYHLILRPLLLNLYWRNLLWTQMPHFQSDRSVYNSWKDHFTWTARPYDLVHTHNLLSYQSAYHEGHGMETALLSVVKDILCALDEDKISVLLLLDIISGVWYLFAMKFLCLRPDWFFFLSQYSPILAPFLPIWKETICNGSTQPIYYSPTEFRSTTGFCARSCSSHPVQYTTVTLIIKALV